MKNLQDIIKDYLTFCRSQKRLDSKTLKAYSIDLKQFAAFLTPNYVNNVLLINREVLENFIAFLHNSYKPKTVKRKLASLKAFFHFLEYRDFIEINPFNKMQIRFREPLLLPKTIPLHTIELFLSTIYSSHANAKTDFQKRQTARDIAVIELLFATGMRISELCSLKYKDIDLYDRVVRIYGKGAKERQLQICNDCVISALENYICIYQTTTNDDNYFFINTSGTRMSEQSVRNMIVKYCNLAGISQHITPHMFRHSFATLLLEEDVDIRYIQEMLGHSSINVTEIYTHVSMAKQKNILMTKHPRRNMEIRG